MMKIKCIALRGLVVVCSGDHELCERTTGSLSRPFDEFGTLIYERITLVLLGSTAPNYANRAWQRVLQLCRVLGVRYRHGSIDTPAVVGCKAQVKN